MKRPEETAGDSLPKTEVAAKLQKEMNERELSIMDIRQIADVKYESARRVVRGDSSPSLPVLRLLSDFFGWDWEESQAMVLRDRERIRHGDLLDISHGSDPDMERISRAWPLLTAQQRRLVMTQIATYVGNNRVEMKQKHVG